MSRNVLVLDDEALIAFDMADIVEANGHNVVGPALSIAEGRSLVSDNVPSAAILDVNVRGEKVWEFAQELMAQNCKVVFCSADTSPKDAEAEFGDCIFLPKPFDASHVQEALRSL